MKSPEAIARDEWLKEAEKKGTLDASTLGGEALSYFLTNRLEAAFLAGLEAGKRIERAAQEKWEK